MNDDPSVQPRRISPKEAVYQDKNRQIYRVTADFGGYLKEYFVAESGQRAGLLVARRESVLLVRQYRLLIDRLSWEVPGGRVDDGEPPEKAAARECFEETGLQCRHLKPLLFIHPGLDSLHNPTHLFYTQEFVETTGDNVDRREIHQHEWIPLSHCVDMIFEQQIVDSLSILAILSYHTLIDRRHS